MPLQIEYESRGFPPTSGLNGGGTLTTSWSELLWAAVTVGRPSVHYVFKNGIASQYEALFRWSLLRMALEQSGPNAWRLQRTQAARELDPTEKGSVNYFVGMIMCKLFAAKLLRAPWALHVDLFANAIGAMLTQRSRPDLIAQITGTTDWVVLESKGRISRPDSDTKKKAKDQAKWLPPIVGGTQKYKVGAVSYLKKDVLNFSWEDPVGKDHDGEGKKSIKIPDDAWRYYYEPVAHVARAAVSQRIDQGNTIRVEEADLRIGIHPKVADLLSRREWTQAKELCEKMSTELEREGFQIDGLRIEAGESWVKPFETRT